MPLFRGRSSSNAHWSKDYVEHLRSIHFALLAVAISGIIISTAPDYSRLRPAYSQLRTIQEVISRKDERLDRLYPVKDDIWKSRWYSFTFNDRRYIFKLQPIISIIYGECGHAESRRTWAGRWNGGNAFAGVVTLQDFAFGWNLFVCNGMSRAYDITELAAGVDVLGQDQDHRFFQTVSVHPVYLSGKSVLNGINNRTWTYLAFLETPDPSQSFKEGAQDVYLVPPDPTSQNMKFIAVGDPRHYSSANRYRMMNMTASTGMLAFMLKVHFTEGRFTPQKYTPQIAWPSWTCTSSFDQCFVELSRVTRSRTTYKIDELAAWLNVESTSNPPREIETFGIKFPVEDQAFWGIVVIIGLVLYAWLHLRELAPRIRQDYSGLDVAWVGLYASLPAYCVVWASILLIPGYAVFVFGLRGSYYEPPIWSFVRSNMMSFSTWIIIPTSFCAFISWKSCLMMRRLALLSTATRNREDSKTRAESLPYGSAVESDSNPKNDH